jgi:hypothetical protein
MIANRWHACRLGVALSVASLACGAALGEDQSREWKVPIVMEKATVRGKVVVLETRHEDRRAASDLKVQVWDTLRDTPRKKHNLLHDTKTDEGGLFTLPLLDEGQYVLVVGDLNLSLSVVPAAPVRKDSSEPKVLLILLPKDVVLSTAG